MIRLNLWIKVKRGRVPGFVSVHLQRETPAQPTIELVSFWQTVTSPNHLTKPASVCVRPVLGAVIIAKEPSSVTNRGEGKTKKRPGAVGQTHYYIGNREILPPPPFPKRRGAISRSPHPSPCDTKFTLPKPLTGC